MVVLEEVGGGCSSGLLSGDIGDPVISWLASNTTPLSLLSETEPVYKVREEQ